MNPRLRLAFFGDDLTGSTDALEQLAAAGVPSALFFEPPTWRQLAAYPGIEAVGVAGITRAMPAREAARTARDALAALRALRPRHVHYKVCSTWDSSPRIGSIGAVIAAAAPLFRQPFVPVIGGAPVLGRYCVFGNLFARLGIGSAGAIYRLDRHPAMNRHPVTPAVESDLLRHLGAQTRLALGLVDVRTIVEGPKAIARAARLQETAGSRVVIFDALEPRHVAAIGAALERRGTPARPCFWVGPSSVEAALLSRWPERKPVWRRRKPPGPFLAVCGSRSLTTIRQIEHALARGFAEVRVGPKAVAAASRLLAAGRPVLLTTRGRLAGGGGVSAEQGRRTARRLGQTLRAVLQTVRPGRLVVAGGDTSSFVARELGIESLTCLRPLTPGAPLCLAAAPGSPADGLEVAFKGGQVGSLDYFLKVSRL